MASMQGVIVFLAVLGAFLTILSLPFSDIHKFIAEVILLGAYGYYLHKKYKIEYYYGMLMLKTREGLSEIDKISRHTKLWQHLVDAGTVISYGMLTLLLFKHVRIRDFIPGMLTLLFITVFLLPNLYPVALSVIGLPYESPGKAITVSGGPDITIPLAAIAILAVGLATVITLGLIYQAGTTLIGLYMNIFGGASATVQPGAYLILPGINIPFIEGVIALLMLLFVHELAHAVLSRVARVPLRSAGILLFGFIPIGAFVDPEEKILLKKPKSDQARVVVAGSVANYALSIVSFVMLMLLVSLPLGAYDTGLKVAAAKEGLPIQKGDIILAINGVEMDSYSTYLRYRSAIQPNSTLIVTTQRGDVEVQTDENALIGVLLQPRVKPSFGWYVFLRDLFALLFALNFFVGSFNLLPIPLFDGHRLLELGLGEKGALPLKIITVLSTASLIAALLPWLLR
ncbi:MAG: site-2 protease family protein [Candidatus Micrarchaeota archaeon]|nr:site-2 protease family protein [Candidatus Micrarchaeota archaeon]